MICLNGVSKEFGSIKAVKAISLQVEKGEIFGLVGPDGAGKTTTIRLLTGVMNASAGEILVLGSSDREAVKGHIGYVPQRFSLYGDLTVMENIRIMGALYGADSRQVKQKATEILSFTRLLPFKDRLADNLSGGMKQKLALAAGLMHRPKLLFLDEPTTGVDPVSRREFWQMLYRLNKEGMTIFVSTPYMDEAELCHRVAFMHNGTIVCCDSPRQLKQDYPYQVLELHAVSKDIKRQLKGLPIRDINAFGEKYHLIVDDGGAAAQQVQQRLATAGTVVQGLKIILPTLEDVFVALAGEVE
ncbi:MAG: ABC transporter ATP-binding protein [Veillonellales bacterium]